MAYTRKARGHSVHLFTVSLQWPQNWGASLHLKDTDHLNLFNFINAGQKTQSYWAQEQKYIFKQCILRLQK